MYPTDFTSAKVSGGNSRQDVYNFRQIGVGCHWRPRNGARPLTNVAAVSFVLKFRNDLGRQEGRLLWEQSAHVGVMAEEALPCRGVARVFNDVMNVRTKTKMGHRCSRHAC